MKRLTRWLVVLAPLAAVPGGCATIASDPVRPEDVPELEEEATRSPSDPDALLRLGVGLAEVGRCEDAVEVANRGRELAPSDPLGPLVVGRCLEEAGSWSEALAVYADFLALHGGSRGAAAVEGRRLLALQGQARAEARLALEREAPLELGGDETLAVLPFVVDGSPEFQPLGTGLAHMLLTDLALVGRFPLVERIRLEALLSELALDPSTVDPGTAARSGRLVGASRVLVGTLSIRGDESVGLGGSFVLTSGDADAAATTEGTLSDLLDLEKDYALGVVESLGYVLDDADRARVRQNRPRDLAAFLSFSRGLIAESRGDFQEAAAQFQAALRRDPAYAQAADGVRRSVGAEVQAGAGPGQATSAVARVDGRLAQLDVDPTAGALETAVLDVASHQPERATVDAGWADTVIDALPAGGDFTPALQALLTVVILIPR